MAARLFGDGVTKRQREDATTRTNGCFCMVARRLTRCGHGLELNERDGQTTTIPMEAPATRPMWKEDLDVLVKALRAW